MVGQEGHVGYTTDFEGRFDCYHAEGKVAGEFLQAIYEGDRAAIGMFADWLIEQGDPRGEQIVRLRKRSPVPTPAFWRLFGLKPEHAAYLTQFSGTRRMKRAAAKAARMPDPLREAVGLPLGKEAAYFVGGTGFHGQDDDDSVLDYNKPPRGQPGLWCRWQPSEDGTAIVWNGAEKFYYYVEWLEYLIKHFLAPWGYILNGEMKWQGEDEEDQGTIVVKNNRVLVNPSPRDDD
jgi:uncharacterized protein (TIGR02996 family)